MSWRDDALCAETDPELFFLLGETSMRQAKSICRSCPVRNECLTEALESEMEGDYRFGVYGGLDPDERGRLISSPGSNRRYPEAI